MYKEEILFKDYLKDWLGGKRYSINSQTIKGIESYIKNHIVPSLGALTLSKLNVMVLQNFVNDLKDKWLANATVKRIFSVIHSSLDMAEKMQLIEKNFASIVIKPNTKRKQLQVWGVQEVQHFLKVASKEPSHILHFILHSSPECDKGKFWAFNGATFISTAKWYLSGRHSDTMARNFSLEQKRHLVYVPLRWILKP